MKLKKELNLLDIFCITTGAMLSSGIFLLPALAYSKAGSAAFVSYLIAGVFAAAGMLSQAELSTAMPKSGGTYYYVTRSMGAGIGTVYGLVTMLSLSLKSAFELIAMSVFIGYLVDVNTQIISVFLCLFFIIINLVGTKGAGRLQVFLVFLIIPVLLVYVSVGFPAIDISNFQPFAPSGIMSVFSTAGFVFVSYGGLLKVASIAEEVKEPGRVLPLGMILSLIVVVFLYMLVVFVTTGVLDPLVLDSSLMPVSDAAGVIFGKWGAIVLTITAIFGFSSAANAGIMGASRYPLALSRDSLLPELFSRVNQRFKTPHHSILLTAVMVIGALFIDLEMVIKSASSVLIITYIFSCLANIIMRESHIQNYQPSFRAPLYPWIQIFGVIGFSFLLIEIGLQSIMISAVLILVGFVIYWFYGRVRTEQEFALMHLIERVTDKELTSHSLETELKEVIRERDDIVRDRFDHLIEDSTFLDIEERMHVDDFFSMISQMMANHLDMKPKQIFKLLKSREEESSTVLGQGLAIPHIVIKGQNKFDILVARSKGGVVFSDDTPDVHAIFVLLGTKDERNFHLRALSAIAQIVQDLHFEKKWMSARNQEALRDIVLLGKRRR